jgi:hypothetical protein
LGIPAIQKRLPELGNLERVIKILGNHAQVEVPAVVHHKGMEFPLYTITMGTTDKTAPCLGLFGGVHGLERIGSEVVIAWLQTLSEMLNWDETLHERLKKTRLVFMPIVNPVGMYNTRRSNGSGVDLMRNSPTIAEEEPYFLIGGHRISNLLPYYSGEVSKFEDMELESRTLCDFVTKEMFPSRLSLSVDVHSGFGSVDRFWFPYAKTKKPPPHLPEIAALKKLFDRTYPNHFYRIEPQAKQYTTHGDLWDYLYDEQQREAQAAAALSGKSANLYVPWTLELGSWLWLKKNPRQVFSSLGPFNPLQPHRLQRILRRHLTLFDFLHRVLLSSDTWTQLSEESRRDLISNAVGQWYE